MPIADQQPHTVTRYAEDEFAAGARPRVRRRWTGGAVGLGVVALLVGALVYAGHSGGSQPAAGGAAPVSLSGVTLPADGTQGVPVGYPRSQEGAASAAANYAIAYGSAGMYQPATRHAVIALIADPTAAAELRGQLDAAFGASASGYGLDEDGNPPAGQTFVARSFVAGSASESYDDSSAVVRVWTSSLLGLAGPGAAKPVSQIWSTLRVTLRWSANDWKWVSATVEPGPTPVTGSQVPSDSGELAKAAQQFQNGIWGPPRAR